MIFLVIMILGTLLIASAAVFFSVLGLVQTFSETAIYWGTSIEVAKLILASFLYRFWDKTNLIIKAISISLIAFLMTITSLGIYGHIITSYQEGNLEVSSQNIRVDTAQQKLDRLQQRISNVNRQIETSKSRIEAIEEDIARVPDNYVTVRRELIQERQPEMDRLEEEISTLYDDRENLYDELGQQQETIADLKIETGEVANKAGPIMFVIEKLGGAGEQAVFWFVLIIVLSFDPTAVALTVYSNKVALSLKEPEEDLLDEEDEPDEPESTPEPSSEDLSLNKEPEAHPEATPEETPDVNEVLSDVMKQLERNNKNIENHGQNLDDMRKHFEREKKKDNIIKEATR